MNRTIKGIIFDMDNTLLRSNIDFEVMKKETYAFLTSRGILPTDLNLQEHTTSTIIEKALLTNRMTEDVIKEMWKIAEKHEIIGMQEAKLEPGVVELLESMKGKYHLVVVTNNSMKAAEAALQDNSIMEYFDHLIGREMMASLKPSPDGFLQVLNVYNDTLSTEWISVGDAWIDGKASKEAGITFLSYNGDIVKMNQMGVFPDAQIKDIRELMQFI